MLHDYDAWLEKLAPHEPTAQYRHNRTGEDNADAHPQIFYGEFDGRRRKRVLAKVIGE